MFDVNFENPEIEVIAHSQYAPHIPRILEGFGPYQLKNHFILFSSGTTGGVKGYALSRDALFTNARAVNEHFQLSASDVWALSLPVYHIGGLSVLARARLLGNKLIDARHWNPAEWRKAIQNATITTIVPTQLYDLVKLKLKAPENLRYLIVGGDFLSSKLKAEALKLGWPVIRTFGMSEVCSQLASAKTPLSDELKVMPIHEVKTSLDQRLLVRSQALFAYQFTLARTLEITSSRDLCDEEGFYATSDRAEIEGDSIIHLGRLGEEYKIAGHLVNLPQLKNTLGAYLVEQDLFGKMELLLEEDERKGKKLILLALAGGEAHLPKISHLFYPVKIDEVRIVESFERTALGKLKLT